MAGISCKPVKGAIFPGLVWAFTRLGLHTDATVLSTSTINGPLGTWAKTATGLYTFTFGTAPDFKVAGAGFRKTDNTSPGGVVIVTPVAAAAGTVGVELKSYDLTTGSIIVRTFTKATGADVDTTAAMHVDVTIGLFDSSVT